MARKSLADFNNDYQAYANYLESAECANDDGYTVYADEYGNIYEATDGDWTKGHGHINPRKKWKGRNPDEPESQGRPWENKWLIYLEEINLTVEDLQLLQKSDEKEIVKIKKLKK